jgi:hypothetical protein
MQADDQPSVQVDLAELSEKQPLAIVFMHEKSRPAFGLARMMSQFTQWKNEQTSTPKKLQLHFVILTEDRSSSEKWLNQIRRYFEPDTNLSVAEGGIEGPGALGLNRLVAVTIVLAENKRVKANFALTQVSDAVDGPVVIKALNELSGGGELPPMEQFLRTPNMKSPNMKQRAQR